MQFEVAIKLSLNIQTYFCPPMNTIYAENDSASKVMQISSQLTFKKKKSINATQETKNNHCKILMQYAYVQH